MIKIDKKRSLCPLSSGLEILGDKWTLLIIRDLMFTNREEFGHFLQAGEGISTNILADRLERLQNCGLIEKTPHPNHGKKFIYTLTDEGIKLAPTIFEFSLWASAAIDDTYIPPEILNSMQHDRESFLKKVEQRIPFITLNLES